MPSLAELGPYILVYGGLLLTLILSLRSASNSLGRIEAGRPTSGIKLAHCIVVLAYIAAVLLGLFASVLLFAFLVG